MILSAQKFLKPLNLLPGTTTTYGISLGSVVHNGKQISLGTYLYGVTADVSADVTFWVYLDIDAVETNSYVITTSHFINSKNAPDSGAVDLNRYLPLGTYTVVSGAVSAITITNYSTNQRQVSSFLENLNLDVIDGSYSWMLGPNAPAVNAFSGGVLLSNHKVFMIPHSYAGTNTVYNSLSNAWETGPAGPGTTAFFGGVFMPNNKVLAIPHSYNGANNIYSPGYSANSLTWCWHPAYNKL